MGFTEINIRPRGQELRRMPLNQAKWILACIISGLVLSFSVLGLAALAALSLLFGVGESRKSQRVRSGQAISPNGHGGVPAVG